MSVEASNRFHHADWQATSSISAMISAISPMLHVTNPFFAPKLPGSSPVISEKTPHEPPIVRKNSRQGSRLKEGHSFKHEAFFKKSRLRLGP